MFFLGTLFTGNNQYLELTQNMEIQRKELKLQIASAVSTLDQLNDFVPFVSLCKQFHFVK